MAAIGGAAACNGDPDTAGIVRTDLSPPWLVELAVPDEDLAAPGDDLSVPIEADLAEAADLAIGRDLSPPPDLTPPPDQVTLDPWGPQFRHPATVPLAGNVGALFVRAGDLDGDKTADLALVDSANAQVVVLFGKGDGTFEAPVKVPLVNGKSLSIADLDGDGRLDVAVLATPTIAALLSDGKRGFVVRNTPFLGAMPRGIVASDLDGDGKVDVAATAAGGNSVSVLAGDGQGGFGNPLVLMVPSVPQGLAAADLDGDQRPELLVQCASNGPFDGKVAILGNTSAKGMPSFAAAVDLLVGPTPVWGPAVADLNNDKIPDVISPSSTAHEITIVLGRGQGMFGVPFFFVGLGRGPMDVDVADFDRDGNLDVVVAEWQTDDAGMLYGGGKLRGHVFPVGMAPLSLAAVDLDGNGKPDLVTANSGSHDLTVLLNAL